jgi:hypothetical protein
MRYAGRVVATVIFMFGTSCGRAAAFPKEPVGEIAAARQVRASILVADRRDYAGEWIKAECYSGRCSLFSPVPEEKAAMAKCNAMVFDQMPSYDTKYDDAVWYKYAEMFAQCVNESYSP